MQILITGGAGFIGTRLAEALARLEADVILFDSFHPQVHSTVSTLRPRGVTTFPGDVRDSGAWDRFFLLHGAPTIVVHLAAETGTGQSLNSASRHATTNVVGTTQLTDALVRHACRPERIVLTSSRAVYGEGSWETGDGEVFRPGPRSGEQLAAARWDPSFRSATSVRALPHSSSTTWARPTNVYAATKLAQEHLLESWCNSYGVPLSILRLQNVYGPGQAVGNAYTGVLTYFARQIAEGEQVEVYEDGQILRDFVYVDDVVDALVRGLSSTDRETRRFDVGGGRAVSLLEVAATMCELGGVRPPVVNGKYRLGDVRAASADIDEAVSALQWSPTVSLNDGLRALVEWVPTQVTESTST